MSVRESSLGCEEECEHSTPLGCSLSAFSSPKREDFTETPTLLLWQVGRGREVGEYKWCDVELSSLLCSDFTDKQWERGEPQGAGCSCAILPYLCQCEGK